MTQKMFLRLSRKRNLVITTAGRVFCTNLGGDGILCEIALLKESRVSVHGKRVKVHASNGTFHFRVDDSSMLVEKLNLCIAIAAE